MAALPSGALLPIALTTIAWLPEAGRTPALRLRSLPAGETPEPFRGVDCRDATRAADIALPTSIDGQARIRLRQLRRT
jgi:hypothetical protein